MFQFPDQDTCYFAHYYPYTYNNLQEFLQELLQELQRSSAPLTPSKGGKGTEQKAVIVIVRVHPGETKNSWITKGFMDFILGDSRKAQLLQDNFVLKYIESRWFDCGKSPLHFNRPGAVLQIQIHHEEMFPFHLVKFLFRVGDRCFKLQTNTLFNMKNLESIGHYFHNVFLDCCVNNKQ
ncbi:LOW QUALITY PROTEIN: hypothetical protein Nmel_005764, partial [Mimus melanotis]